MIQKELEAPFMMPKSNIEIEIINYSVNKEVDGDLNPVNTVRGIDYMVLNGLPVKIHRLKLDGESLREKV